MALFAMGYVLVFGLLDIVNLAHGATYMWGAYIGLLCVTRLGLPFWVAVPAAMIGGGVTAVLLDRLAFKPLRTPTYGGIVLWAGFLVVVLGIVAPWPTEIKAATFLVGGLAMVIGLVTDYRTARPLATRQSTRLAPMISSIGASIVMIGLARGMFGSQVARFPPETLPLDPIRVTDNLIVAPVQVILLVVALVLLVALRWLISSTQTGRAIRAIAFSEKTSRLLGIDVDRVIVQTFFLSGALAGAAGALLGLAFNRLDPNMGAEVELAGLTVIIVGGMGSISGAAAAAFIVGAMRVLTVAYLDSSFRDAFVFALLILVLLVRPSGIFGKAASVRA
ncbi:MAG: amino acid/amide transporter rane protein 1, family [Chloroflexi bacterium]|nr:amino acid/amide transporter rane protein 1, family [Chloroflexota bacterium]